MAALARKVATLLLVGLFVFIVRFVYHPLSVVSGWNQDYIFDVTDFLRVRDVDLFGAWFCVGVSAALAIVIYVSVIRIWRYVRGKR